jgi:four helix bundle protein
MDVRGYRELEVWQKAMDLVVACYQTSQNFPKTEAFGLTSQLQRAAVSIPANIAEGQGRQHLAEFIQFLSIAYGSLSELETHIQIAQRLNYIDVKTMENLLTEAGTVGRLLNGLMRSLRNKQTK